MIYYTLNTNIDGNKILGDIQKLVNKFPQSELVHKVLVIKLETISDHNGDSPLPKLEYKDL
jgi:hypothetical protein